jgi:hypothetical protein
MGLKVARVALSLVALLIGVAVGVIGSFEHRVTATLGGVPWPTGLLLSLGAVVALMLLAEGLLDGAPTRPDRAVPSRLSVSVCAGAGWLLALLWLTYLGPPPTLRQKGDIILVNDWRSIGYLLGGMFLVTVGIYRAWAASLTARIKQRSGAPGLSHPKV